MKDSIEYLAIVVIACAAGFWMLNQWIAEPIMSVLDQTVTMITTAGGSL